ETGCIRGASKVGGRSATERPAAWLDRVSAEGLSGGARSASLRERRTIRVVGTGSAEITASRASVSERTVAAKSRGGVRRTGGRTDRLAARERISRWHGVA